MPLTSPTLSYLSSTQTRIVLEWEAASGGTPAYTYDVHRSTTSGFTPAAGTLIGANATPPFNDNDADLAWQTLYYYQLVTTDTVLATVTSNEVSGGLAFGGAAAAGVMTLATARALIKRIARNAGDSSEYSDTDLDVAIQHVGNEFCRNTRALRDDLPLVVAAASSSVTVDFGVPVMPEQLADLTWTDREDPLIVLPYTDFNALRACDPDASGPPTHATVIRNADAATAGTFQILLWPANDEARTITVRAWLNFSQWVPGVSAGSAAAITLNLPYAWLSAGVLHGMAADLQITQPEQGWAMPARARYEKFMQSMMGAGNLGEKTVRRERVR